MKRWSWRSFDRLVATLLATPYLAVILLALAGCSSLLPSSKEETVSSWNRFEQVKAAYDHVETGSTRADLKQVGFDLENSPNLQVLNYLDIASMIQSIPKSDLDPGLEECVQVRDECQAYVFELKRIKTHRYGNFWADFLNFRRKTDSAGWQFKSLFVLTNDHLTYKIWSGAPRLETHREERNPLGPLQGSGAKVIDLFGY